MNESSNHTKFKEELFKFSENKDYNEALKEWFLIYTTKKDNNCICGHHIIKNCIFKNKHNSNIITIGSTCVKKFFNQDYSDMFEIKNILTKYSHKLLLLCKENKIINDFEYNFIDYLPTFKKYSEKQTNIFFKIHEKICIYLTKEKINIL
jgi:hypothetical protein